MLVHYATVCDLGVALAVLHRTPTTHQHWLVATVVTAQ
jgi:hypothetical protein